MRTLYWLIILHQILSPGTALFKLTNARCESFNKSWTVFKECRLRAVKRDVTVFNMHVVLMHPADDIDMNGLILKKYNGGYKPFIINYTIDACSYMKHRNNLAASTVFDIWKDSSNINHTCPYYGDVYLKEFFPKHSLLKLPLPAGDYALFLTWYFYKEKVMTTNVYFAFADERH